MIPPFCKSAFNSLLCPWKSAWVCRDWIHVYERFDVKRTCAVCLDVFCCTIFPHPTPIAIVTLLNHKVNIIHRGRCTSHVVLRLRSRSNLCFTSARVMFRALSHLATCISAARVAVEVVVHLGIELFGRLPGSSLGHRPTLTTSVASAAASSPLFTSGARCTSRLTTSSPTLWRT